MCNRLKENVGYWVIYIICSYPWIDITIIYVDHAFLKVEIKKKMKKKINL